MSTTTYRATDILPVYAETEISAECGLTIEGVRLADHIEMMHERELAPGTTEADLFLMHWAMHPEHMDDHDHSWEPA